MDAPACAVELNKRQEREWNLELHGRTRMRRWRDLAGELVSLQPTA